MSGVTQCHNCKCHIGGDHCGIPYKDGMTQWVRCRDTYRFEPYLVDGHPTTGFTFICAHFDPKSKWDKFVEKVEKPYYAFLRNVEKVTDFFRYSCYGRIKNGFDPRDCWDLGSATAKYLKPRLDKYIKDYEDHGHGVPSKLVCKDYVIDNNLAQYFDGELQDEWFEHDSDMVPNSIAWLNILKKIQFSIGNTVAEFHGDVDYDVLRQVRRDTEEGYRLLGLFFENLWD